MLQAFLSTPCRKLSWMAFVIGWGVMSSSDDLKNKNLRIVILSFGLRLRPKNLSIVPCHTIIIHFDWRFVVAQVVVFCAMVLKRLGSNLR